MSSEQGKDAEVVVESVVGEVTGGDVVALDVEPTKQRKDDKVVRDSVAVEMMGGEVRATDVKSSKQVMEAEVVESVQAEGEVGTTDVEPTEQSGDAEVVKSIPVNETAANVLVDDEEDQEVPLDMTGWSRNRRRRHLKKCEKLIE